MHAEKFHSPIYMIDDGKTWIDSVKDYWELLGIIGLIAAFVFNKFRKTRQNYKKGVGLLATFRELMDVQTALHRIEVLIKEEIEKASELHRYNSARIDLLLETSNVPSWRANGNGECVEVNEAYCALFDREEKELLGDGWFSVIAKHDLERVSSYWIRACQRRAKSNIEFEAVLPDKTTFQAKAIWQPYFNLKGEFVEMQGTTKKL